MATPDFDRDLGTRIRELRATRKWTQRSLAAILDVDRETISAIEHGRRRITVRELLILHFHEQVDLHRLLRGIQLDFKVR